MLFRNLLLVLGGLCILAGLALCYAWVSGGNSPASLAGSEPAAPPAPVIQITILKAAHSIPSGTLLQSADIGWKEVGAGELRPGNLVRGQFSETEFLGAITRREFAEGEALIASELVKLSDRRFLAAALKPGSRAVSIAVDAAQSASGLILPGNHVDVILTQSLGEGLGDAKRKTVAETFLRDVRVIAVDQLLSQQPKAAPSENTIFTETRVPKTVTLELSEKQAERLFVATQLGSLQLSVRPLENSQIFVNEDANHRPPTWASDVSSALKEIGRKPPEPLPSGSTLESLIRRPPSSL
jgi:pilus assembly protein CpaB